jgi:hypothetical protein
MPGYCSIVHLANDCQSSMAFFTLLSELPFTLTDGCLERKQHWPAGEGEVQRRRRHRRSGRTGPDAVNAVESASTNFSVARYAHRWWVQGRDVVQVQVIPVV